MDLTRANDDFEIVCVKMCSFLAIFLFSTKSVSFTIRYSLYSIWNRAQISYILYINTIISTQRRPFTIQISRKLKLEMKKQISLNRKNRVRAHNQLGFLCVVVFAYRQQKRRNDSLNSSTTGILYSVRRNKLCMYARSERSVADAHKRYRCAISVWWTSTLTFSVFVFDFNVWMFWSCALV